MLKLVFLQAIAALISIAVATLMFGLRGAASAGLGALACLLPTAVFAGWLIFSTRRTGQARTSAFFTGEALKTLISLMILVLVATLYPGVHWGALVMGLIITLQANFLAFLVKP